MKSKYFVSCFGNQQKTRKMIWLCSLTVCYGYDQLSVKINRSLDKNKEGGTIFKLTFLPVT